MMYVPEPPDNPVCPECGSEDIDYDWHQHRLFCLDCDWQKGLPICPVCGKHLPDNKYKLQETGGMCKKCYQEECKAYSESGEDEDYINWLEGMDKDSSF